MRAAEKSPGVYRVVEAPVLYLGTPVVLISSLNEDETVNVAPMSSAWWVGQSAMLGLDASSQTTLNLRRTGECVLNLASSDVVDAVDRLALTTATPDVPHHKAKKGYRARRDKLAISGLTSVASDLVRPPRVAECGVQLEATVAREHPFAGDGAQIVAFEVETVRVHVAEELMIEGSARHIDPDRWDPLIMKFCEFYGNGRNLRDSRLAHGWAMPPVPARGSAMA